VDRRPTCLVRDLGLLDYAAALALQEDLVARRRAETVEDHLLLLEHPHVITKGSGAHEEHILLDEARQAAVGLTVHETTRGGDVTYHGPGQLVGYPILLLQAGERDAHAYLRRLEEVLIRTVGDWGLEAGRHPDYTGVWVEGEKVAAIGVRLSRWVTSHGFALNVHCDLDFFSAIVPCGIRDKGVTSLERLLGRAPRIDEVADRVRHHFGAVFDRRMLPVPRPAVAAGGKV
jgi:lipoyl(octanoyl) transferase